MVEWGVHSTGKGSSQGSKGRGEEEADWKEEQEGIGLVEGRGCEDGNSDPEEEGSMLAEVL